MSRMRTQSANGSASGSATNSAANGSAKSGSNPAQTNAKGAKGSVKTDTRSDKTSKSRGATAVAPVFKRAALAQVRSEPIVPKPTSEPVARPRALTTQPVHSPLERRPLNEVWAEYKRTQDMTIRNFLWEKYLPLVRYIAERTYTRLPDEVDVNDLMSAGMFGLMDAIDAFELDRGIKFETYSANRIKGAILDELRAMDWVPRLVRHRTAKVDGARQRFEMEEGRAPTDVELSDWLGVKGEEFDKIKKDSRAVGTISLNRKCFQSDGSKDVTEIDVIKDETQRNPLHETQRRDIKDLITKGLSRAERLIIVLYYYEEMTMKEIGATLDLSESRVSQMHSSILARLKAQMQHKTGELEPAKEG